MQNVFFLDDDYSPELSADNRLKVVSVLASRSSKVRTLLPTGLHTEHSLVEFQPLYENEAAIEVRFFEF